MRTAPIPVPSQPILPLSAVAATGVLVIFLIVPALLMVAVSFISSSFAGFDWRPTLHNYERLISSGMALSVFLKSIRIGAVVTVIVLVLAYPMAYWIAMRDSRHRHLFLLLIFVPYWISYVIRTYAWYPLLGTNGVLNFVLMKLGILSEPSLYFLFSGFSVHIGLIYVWFPFAAIPIYLALDRIDHSLLEASTDLGATRLQTFWRVIFPLSISGTIGGAMLVFILAAGSYVTPKLLGGPSSIMFGEIIADQFGGTFDWSFGATLGFAFVIGVAAVVLIVGRRVRLKEVFFGSEV